MSYDAFWRLFLETGELLFYLLYRALKPEEPA